MHKRMDLTLDEFLLLQCVHYQLVPKIQYYSELRWEIYKKILDFLDADCDMPYGTQTGDDGDSEEWIYERLDDIFEEEKKYNICINL